jgi:hypothetical protein
VSDASGDSRASVTASTTATTDQQPNLPPTISGFEAINGGCECGGGAAPQVGVEWTTTYPSGSSGGSCVFTRDGTQLDVRGCAGNGVASHQFYSQPTGSHKYCGYIQMPDGETSNTLCETINVTG